MPIPINDALTESELLAASKAASSRDVPKFVFAAVLAGAFVGIAVVLLLSVGGPLAAAGSPFTKLVCGAVFGIALTLVVFAGGELLTGNMMVMTHGAVGRTTTWVKALWVCVLALIGNGIGSVVFALLVHGGGSFGTGPAADFLAATVKAKDALSGPQLFWRAVLCNMLVCLGLWMAARTRSDVAKLVVLWWALLAFIASGFEHSVANMTTFSLAAFSGTGTWGMLVRNLVWTVPGNLVGGALVVGGAYAYLGRNKPDVSTASAADQSSDAPIDVTAATPRETVGAAS